MYARPTLVNLELAAEAASCTPAPGTKEWCEGNGGVWIPPTVCLTPPEDATDFPTVCNEMMDLCPRELEIF